MCKDTYDRDVAGLNKQIADLKHNVNIKNENMSSAKQKRTFDDYSLKEREMKDLLA